MVRSSRWPRAARKPPTTMPAAPHNMKPVTTNEVIDSGRPCIFCSAGPAKLCTALRAQVDQKKNEKHSQTEGRRRKASGCSVGAEEPAFAAVA